MHDASDTCMSISASTCLFDSGASKHITSCKSLFTSLADAPKGGSETCVKEASYVVKGIGQVVVTPVASNVVTLENVLYVPSIRNNLIPISAIAIGGYRNVFDGHRSCQCHNIDRHSSSRLV